MIELGPERLQHLTRLISRPLGWKAFHIAGTNGKGTTAARLSSFLTAAGHCTGRFTSPHLIDRWDCIAINGVPINERQFRDAESTIKDRVSYRNKSLKPSEFELLTATAFEVFNREKVNYAVVECGMGGLLDATNVLRPEEVQASIITSIDYDHTDFLGDSLTEIVEHKAGIMKPGVPCFAFSEYSSDVVCMQDSDVDEGKMSNNSTIDELLQKKAADTGADLVQVPQRGGMVCYPELLSPLQNSGLSTGDIFGSTVILAYTAMKSTLPRDEVPEWAPRQLETVIKGMKWPGRLEHIKLFPWVNYNEEILLDGAHNQGSARLLAHHVNNSYRQPGQPITWLVAFSKGKNFKRILEKLIGPNDDVILTQFGPVDGMPWVQPASPEEVRAAVLELHQQHQSVSTTKVWTPLYHVRQNEDFPIARSTARRTRNSLQAPTELQNAVEQAISIAKGKIVIAGSLYLVGDVHRALRNSMEGQPSNVSWS